MKKITLLLFAALSIFSLSGCISDSQEYKAFIKKHNSDNRFYCDKYTGFFMEEYFIHDSNPHTTLKTVRNDLNQPTRCTNQKSINVKVLETSLNSSREFN